MKESPIIELYVNDEAVKASTEMETIGYLIDDLTKEMIPKETNRTKFFGYGIYVPKNSYKLNFIHYKLFSGLYDLDENKIYYGDTLKNTRDCSIAHLDFSFNGDIVIKTDNETKTSNADDHIQKIQGQPCLKDYKVIKHVDVLF